MVSPILTPVVIVLKSPETVPTLVSSDVAGTSFVTVAVDVTDTCPLERSEVKRTQCRKIHFLHITYKKEKNKGPTSCLTTIKFDIMKLPSFTRVFTSKYIVDVVR